MRTPTRYPFIAIFEPCPPNETESGENGYYYAAYETVKLLQHLLNKIEGTPTRQKMLAAARQLDNEPYHGLTGIKGFTETAQTGWYDVLALKAPPPLSIEPSTTRRSFMSRFVGGEP